MKVLTCNMSDNLREIRVTVMWVVMGALVNTRKIMIIIIVCSI